MLPFASDRSMPEGSQHTHHTVHACGQVADGQARKMLLDLDVPSLECPASVIASPFKFGGTPVTYRRPPPELGEHTEEVLTEIAGCSKQEVALLRARGAI